jgi:hypothetical protein
VRSHGGETAGKRLLENPKSRWEDNIKIHLTKIGCVDWMSWNWMELAQDRFQWPASTVEVLMLQFFCCCCLLPL